MFRQTAVARRRGSCIAAGIADRPQQHRSLVRTETHRHRLSASRLPGHVPARVQAGRQNLNDDFVLANSNTVRILADPGGASKDATTAARMRAILMGGGLGLSLLHAG
jgi:hypothetical protein